MKILSGRPLTLALRFGTNECAVLGDKQRKEKIVMNIDKVVSEALQAVFGEAQYTTLSDASVLSRLPSSKATFPGGGHYQIELVGPNSPKTLMRLLDMARNKNVPVHRVVGTMNGLGDPSGRKIVSDNEIKEMVRIERGEGIELIAAPIMPLTNVEGVAENKHPSQASWFGPHCRGVKTVKAYLTQMCRGIDLGLRCFLIWDFGALAGAQHSWTRREIPADVRFKASIFGGASHAIDVKNWLWREDRLHRPVRTAVTAVNPVPLEIAGFAEIRQATPADVALDVHVTTLIKMLGLDRIEEAGEIIRVASPVNVKIERGEEVAALMDEQTLCSDVFPQEIESAKKILAHMKKYPELKMVEK